MSTQAAFASVALPNGRRIQCTTHGKKDVPFIYWEVFTEACYEQEGVSLSGLRTVLDVGANIGLFALRVKEASPNARVYCFEPLPPTHDCLRANLAPFGDVEPLQVAVSDRPHQLKLTYYPNSPGNTTRHPELKKDAGKHYANTVSLSWVWRFDKLSSVLLALVYPLRRWIMRKSFARLYENAQTFECPAQTLDGFLSERKLGDIDLLKIDVEGGEREVLAGLSDENLRRVRQLVLELEGDYKKEYLPKLEARLRAAGFTHIALRNDVAASDPREDTLPCMLYAVREPQAAH